MADEECGTGKNAFNVLCLSRTCHHWKEAMIDEKVAQDGIARCYVCGETLEACNKRAEETGFDECEMIAK